MVGRRTSFMVSLCLALFTGSLASSQPLGDGRPVTSDALQRAYTTTGISAEELHSMAVSDNAMTRVVLARFLALHPDVEALDILTALAESEDQSVALIALLALSRNRDAAAPATLEHFLSSSDAAKREYAAIALHLRAVLAEADGLVPPTEGILSRALSFVTSDEGRDWLLACDDYLLLQQAEQRWLDEQTALSRLMTDESTADCVAAMRRNPGLLLPLEPIDATGYPMRALEAPDMVIVYAPDEMAVDLLVSGQHEPLAGLVFRVDDLAGRLHAFVEAVTRVCPTTAEMTPSMGLPARNPSSSPQRETLLQGAFALTLGVINHPFAFRPGRGDFVLSEDLELTFLPHGRLRYVRSLDSGDELWAPPAVELIDGYALSLKAGALISSRFFFDRSRPTGDASFLWDQGDGQAAMTGGTYDGYRVSLAAQLSAGHGDDARDLSRFPAPHLAGRAGVSYYLNDISGGQLRVEREIGLEVEVVEHLWRDRTAPPREERWMEPRVNARWLFASPSSAFRPGVLASSELRLSAPLPDLAATSSNGQFLLSWRRQQLQVEGWAGVGVATTLLGEGSTAVGPTGGFLARYQGRPSQLDELRLIFTVSLSREASNFGRSGYSGFVERAEGRIGFALSDEMRGDAGLRLFLEHASFEDVGDEASWGGFSLYIPIDLVGIDQEIGYLMRYSALIDTDRFGYASQEIFEALITAGMRF